ncbi:MAG: hypothetical protein K2O18_12490 [Oscillospiraceae bacterium]|nr:hypothetical protein [Oscillospiraceae bacterium]
MYPRSFQDSNGDGIGDISGIIPRLPYLRQLGVDVIWLSPFYQSLRRYNGYNVNDYREIQLEFGILEDFDGLLHQAHRMGLKIVIDLVINYTSKEHFWFQESRKSGDNPYRDVRHEVA